MPAAKKNITFDDYKEGVDVSFKLGRVEGIQEMQAPLEDVRRQLADMLRTNTRLLQLLVTEDGYPDMIKLNPCAVRTILGFLQAEPKSKIQTNCYHNLLMVYETTTGKQYKYKGIHLKKGKRKRKSS